MFGNGISQPSIRRHVRGVTPYLFGNSPSSAAHLGQRQRDEQQAIGSSPALEVSTAMSMMDRIRHRRMINRENRAIDRAWRSAPSQAMRDEIAIFTQRRLG